eukprot:TRINITY_DN15111_c0_g1_i1.p1 TRINITY_DN15111_c0_g1~~TRINITY_DN15111_c0_g1_i1.p1  ORF type:complete len:186 (-),score=25.44 TRINITY_DN15111_c0_g1_i1:230-787(-)
MVLDIAKTTQKTLKPRWADLLAEDSSEDESDAGSSSSVSPLHDMSMLSTKTVTKIDGSLAADIYQPIELASVSAAPLADSVTEDHAPLDLHSADGSPELSISDTTPTEFLNAGSALHRVGTCVPCKFSLTKRGCNIGLGCNFCHHPHEGVNRNSLRKRLQGIKKEIDRGYVLEGLVLKPWPIASQ